MSPHPSISPSLRRELPAAAALLAITLLFFWKLAFTNLIIARGDIFYYFYPYRDYAAQAVREAHIPLWNPYLFMGAPFMANSQVGFFYPFNLAMSWLDTTRAIDWTIVLHIFIAASGVYVFARSRLGLSILAAFMAGVSFGLGGYLGTQIEHVNQLQGLAWIGWIFLAYERAGSDKRVARGGTQQTHIQNPKSKIQNLNWLPLSILIALQLLAGHTQSVFITFVGLGIYAIWPAIETLVMQRSLVSCFLHLASRLLPILVASLFAIALSAIQLLPTFELTQQSTRSGGLPTNLAVSFSLDPRWLGRALLPDYAGAMPSGGEFTAFFSITALVLAMIGARTAWSRSHPASAPVVRAVQPPTSNFQLPTSNFQLPISNVRAISIIALVGLVLAFGGYNPLYYLLLKVPGFDLFRAPARWIGLFVFAGSLLSGVGLDALRDRPLSFKNLLLPIAALGLLIALTFFSSGLTPPGASGPLTTPDAKSVVLWIGALILVALWCTARSQYRRSTAFRGLSSALRIPRSALLLLCCLELFVATRGLAYNLRPTASDALSNLRPALTYLLAAQQNQQPPGRFLSLSDILFDPGDMPELKSIYGDQLSDDAFYDLIVATKAKEIVAPNLPLYYRLAAVDGYDGGVLPLRTYSEFQKLFLDPNLIQPDGRLREQLRSIPASRWLDLMNAHYVLTDKVSDQWYDGVLYDLQFTTRLKPGDVAQADRLPRLKADALGIVYSEPASNVALAQVDVTFEDGAAQSLILSADPITTTNGLSVTRLKWAEPQIVKSIRVTGQGGVTIRGMALIDQSSGAFQSFVVAADGQYWLAHSGDVKVYENLNALRVPRAFVVTEARVVASDDEAIRLMQDAKFDPSRTVVLIGDQGSGIGDQGLANQLVIPSSCHLVTYEPEHVVVDVSASQDGYLVLADADYPGWIATVDGQPVSIERANIMFRAVRVSTGQHRVEMRYEPQSFAIGMWITIGTWVLLVLMVSTNMHRIHE